MIFVQIFYGISIYGENSTRSKSRAVSCDQAGDSERMHGDIGIEAAGGDVAINQLFHRPGRHRFRDNAIPAHASGRSGGGNQRPGWITLKARTGPQGHALLGRIRTARQRRFNAIRRWFASVLRAVVADSRTRGRGRTRIKTGIGMRRDALYLEEGCACMRVQRDQLSA